MLRSDRDHAEHVEHFEQHHDVLRRLHDLHGEQSGWSWFAALRGRGAPRHRIVNAAPVEGFQNFLGSPGLIGSFFLRAANGERANLPRGGVGASAGVGFLPGADPVAAALPDSIHVRLAIGHARYFGIA